MSVDHTNGSVLLGSWRQFSYDCAFGPDVNQETVYAGCVARLADAVLQGYNATVLAYGPTGSGKTFTMGMGGTLQRSSAHLGIIPRAIR